MNGEDDEHEDEAERHVDVRLQGGLHRVNPAAPKLARSLAL
jgi:hypothetical protein